MPDADGEARYRLRLIANAMKIAVLELEAGPLETTVRNDELRAFAGSASGNLRDAIRTGKLDGNAQLYVRLTELTAQRRRLLGQD